MKDGGEDVNEEMLDDTTSTNTASKDNKEHNTVLVISDLALSLFNYEVHVETTTMGPTF